MAVKVKEHFEPKNFKEILCQKGLNLEKALGFCIAFDLDWRLRLLSLRLSPSHVKLMDALITFKFVSIFIHVGRRGKKEKRRGGR